MHKTILLSVIVILIRSTLASYPDPKSDTTSLASTPLLDPDCECAPQGGICHPPSAKNCCNGFTCHFEPNGNYGLCQPPDAKDECLVEGAYHCNIPGLSCCPDLTCNKVGDGESYRCDADKGLFGLGSSVFGEFKKEKKESRNDGDVHAKCLDLGAHHCNIPGLSCCPGTKCKRVDEGGSPECVKDTDTDSDAGKAQKPLIPEEEDICGENSCIAEGYNCHPSRSKGRCPPSPCCDGFTCIDLLGIGEPHCLKMNGGSEYEQAIKSASGVEIGVKNEKGGKPVPSREGLSGLRRMRELFRGLVA